MSKEIRFWDEAHQELKKGVDLIADAVKTTLGPKGYNCLYGYTYGFPVSTKDGVTVSRQIEAFNQLQQQGVLLVRQAAQKTVDEAGDGTTTACVLTQAIYTEGLKLINKGINPIIVKRGMDKAADIVVDYIKSVSKPVQEKDKMIQVAKISANNDGEIAEIIVEAITKVGSEGVITIEDNYANDKTEIITIEGMQYNNGVVNQYFFTDIVKQCAEYQDPYILILDMEIYDVNPLIPIVDVVVGQMKRPLIVMAHNVAGLALQTLVYNKTQYHAPLLAVKAPGFGDMRAEMLIDIAIMTGATVVGSGSGLMIDKVKIEHLGQCSRIFSNRHYTSLFGGKGDKDKIQGRITQIEGEMNKTESDYEREKLQERYAKFTSGVAVIRVGAQTEVEQKNKKALIDDALHATRAAIEEGVVIGGGITLMECSELLDNIDPEIFNETEYVGLTIIKDSLTSPIRQLAKNAGLDAGEIVANSKITNKYFNFLDEKYYKAEDYDVVDPAKVVISSFKNAVSVAGMLLTTSCLIVEDEDDIVPAARMPKPRND